MDQHDFAMSTGTKPGGVIVAVDDGYARMKICVPTHSNSANPWFTPPSIREFGTVISSRPDALSNSDGSVSGRWEADGQQFSVSEMITGDNTSTDDFHWSRMNRVLVNHYLCECGLADRDIDLLVVGLPMSQFFTPGGKRSDYSSAWSERQGARHGFPKRRQPNI